MALLNQIRCLPLLVLVFVVQGVLQPVVANDLDVLRRVKELVELRPVTIEVFRCRDEVSDFQSGLRTEDSAISLNPALNVLRAVPFAERACKCNDTAIKNTFSSHRGRM